MIRWYRYARQGSKLKLEYTRMQPMSEVLPNLQYTYSKRRDIRRIYLALIQGDK